MNIGGVIITKLYIFNEKENCYYYDEAWVNGSEIVEHTGKLGTEGCTTNHRLNPLKTDEENVSRILQSAVEAGYREIPQESLYTLIIEYKIKGFGTARDVKKIHRLQELMNETLGWTGLGHCDGNSIGSGTMEVCCFVVDFELGKQVISESLKGTEFKNYTRIFDENAPAQIAGKGPVET